MPHFLFLFLAAFLSISCASSPQNPAQLSPDALLKMAQNYYTKQKWHKALKIYSLIEKKYPYTNINSNVQLIKADIFYQTKDYLEAENTYKHFQQKYPQHSQIDFVYLRLASCLFQRLPSTADLDLSLSTQTLEYLENVLNAKNSSHKEQAQKMKDQVLKLQAQKEEYIAHFYWRQKKYPSALARYEYLFSQYPFLTPSSKTLYEATISAFRAKNLSRARHYFQQLSKAYPSSKEEKQAKQELTYE